MSCGFDRLEVTDRFTGVERERNYLETLFHPASTYLNRRNTWIRCMFSQGNFPVVWGPRTNEPSVAQMRATILRLQTDAIVRIIGNANHPPQFTDDQLVRVVLRLGRNRPNEEINHFLSMVHTSFSNGNPTLIESLQQKLIEISSLIEGYRNRPSRTSTNEVSPLSITNENRAIQNRTITNSTISPEANTGPSIEEYYLQRRQEISDRITEEQLSSEELESSLEDIGRIEDIVVGRYQSVLNAQNYARTPDASFSIVFIQSFWAGLNYQLPLSITREPLYQIREEPVAFLGGVLLGIPTGIWQNLREWWELMILVQTFRGDPIAFSITHYRIGRALRSEEAEQVIAFLRRQNEIYNSNRWQYQRELAQGIIAIYERLQQPAFWNEFAHISGQTCADEINVWIRGTSAEEKGKLAGQIIGNMIVEIVVSALLTYFIGPGGVAVTGARAAGSTSRIVMRTPRLVRLIFDMLDEIPVLRRILNRTRTSRVSSTPRVDARAVSSHPDNPIDRFIPDTPPNPNAQTPTPDVLHSSVDSDSRVARATISGESNIADVENDIDLPSRTREDSEIVHGSRGTNSSVFTAQNRGLTNNPNGVSRRPLAIIYGGQRVPLLQGLSPRISDATRRLFERGIITKQWERWLREPLPAQIIQAIRRFLARQTENKYGDIATVRIVHGVNVIDKLTGRLMLAHLHTGTAVTNAARRLRQLYFDIGHIRARLLGGKGGINSFNIMIQSSYTNQREFKVFEGRLARLVRDSTDEDKIFFSIQPRYSSITDIIPKQIVYKVRINGKTVVRAIFSNKPNQTQVDYF